MGEDPRDIERRIEDTREQMGDTVQALSDKADVPGRMKGYVGDKKDAVTSKITGTAGSAAETGSGLAGQATEKARRGAGIAQENPLGLAVGSIAAGFVIGVLLPTSRVENEHLGPIADQVKDQVRDVGGEAVEHGKQVAQEAAQAATETARSTSREHAEDLQDSIRDSARETAGQVRQ